ncbi:helix-turn-helix domain-containing protein [Leptospira sp. GIMC2001]|uniref:helix-turn-helix domain-containing protein n=1 Tax=Leptospira sp. GIMC2001 TaxID=1513297 RepID=UPI003FA52EC7
MKTITSKTTSFKSILDKELKNKRVKKEYDALEKDFTLAKEIITLRKSMNLTQKELADKIGTSQPAIARVESGSYKNVSLTFLNKLAEALNAEPIIHFKRKKVS